MGWLFIPAKCSEYDGTVQLTFLRLSVVFFPQHCTNSAWDYGGAVFLKLNNQILSPLLELCACENTTSHSTSRWRTRPSCLKVVGRLWLIAHNIEFTPLWNESRFVPSRSKDTGEGLPSFFTPILHHWRQWNYTETILAQGRREQSPNTSPPPDHKDVQKLYFLASLWNIIQLLY